VFSHVESIKATYKSVSFQFEDASFKHKCPFSIILKRYNWILICLEVEEPSIVVIELVLSASSYFRVNLTKLQKQ